MYTVYSDYTNEFFSFDFEKNGKNGELRRMNDSLESKNKEIETEWAALEQKCADCTGCSLYKTKTNTVFGCGNRNSRIMFIGEAPGESEDLQGIPFVGASGQLLDRYFDAVDLPRESVYIANILKCRPPHNRDPLPEEEDVCINHLRAQLRLVKPKILVCLGRISAGRLIKPKFRITAEHGKWFQKGGYDMCAVYHPSALLRDASKREDMLIDMREIARRVKALEREEAEKAENGESV